MIIAVSVACDGRERLSSPHIRHATASASSHVVSANNVRSFEDQRGFRSQGAIKTLGHRRIFSVAGQGSPDK